MGLSCGARFANLLEVYGDHGPRFSALLAQIREEVEVAVANGVLSLPASPIVVKSRKLGGSGCLESLFTHVQLAAMAAVHRSIELEHPQCSVICASSPGAAVDVIDLTGDPD